MSEPIPTLPAITDEDLRRSGLPSMMEMSPGLAIFFNDALYARCKSIASLMANARGVMPKHLIGCPEACFAIVSRAIVWKLDPYAVAMATYQTPGGQIGYEGKLIQAIIENSGGLEPGSGGVTFQHVGDWKKVHKKFKIETSPKGGKYPIPTWTDKDAADLSVIVSAQLRGESNRRELQFDLLEAFPLNSPLWATAPNRQICYTSVRAFGNLVVPALIMGIPFDVDPTGFYGEPMMDVTPPRPAASAFDRQKSADPAAQSTQDGGGAPAAQQTAAEDDPAPATSEGAAGPSGQDIHSEGGEPEDGGEETTLDRGKRLLRAITITNDVADLRLSIQEELEEVHAELDGPKLLEIVREWNDACNARSKEIASPAATEKTRAKSGKATGK